MKCPDCQKKCDNCGQLFVPESTTAPSFDLPAAYQKAVDTLKKFFPKTNGIPKLDSLKFDLEKIRDFQEPKMVLVPPCSWNEVKKAFKNACVSDIFKDEKVEEWRVYIVEGAKEMKAHEWDDVDKTLGQRLKSKKGGGMDRFIYALLGMQCIDNAIDGGLFFTLLDSDSDNSYPLVPFAYSSGSRPYFGWDHVGYPFDSSRFCSTVRGNVLDI